MDQALDPEAYIYEGFWRNLSKDTTRSLTLTLCPTYSVILTNALALFVAMAGGQLWTIIRFSLHQLRAISRPETMNRMHNQQQVVLRNTTTDIATARLMLYLAWTCRKNARGAIGACITILVLAMFNAIFFMVAGTFSNTLISAGSTVLSRSPFCGVWNQTYFDIAGYGNNPTSTETLSLSTEFIVNRWNEVQLDLEYARACYTDQPARYWDSGCGTLEKPRLNWTMDLSASCPFGAEVCSHDADVITFDTGPIDSHGDLGMNANAKERIRYRRVTQCTVLNDTRFTTSFTNDDLTGTPFQYKVAHANYGPTYNHPGSNETATYLYSNFADFYTQDSGQGTTPYQIGTAFSFGKISDQSQASTPSFAPISQLVVDDADVGLLFLSFTGRYTQPVDDPWFSAHVLDGDSSSPLEILQTLYRPDRQINTVGCAERHQYCTSQNICTPLAGGDQVYEYFTNHMKLTPSQNVTLLRIYEAAGRSSLPYVVQDISHTSSPVLAINNSASASFTISLKLPNHQWQSELDRWHSIAMARLQRTIVEYSTGQIAPQTKYLLPPQTSSDKWLCRNQRINSTVFQSFNVVALIVLIIFGLLIIIISLNVERLATWVQCRWNIGGRGRDMWIDHDMLGKQRWRAMFSTPQSSMHVNSPVIHVHSPYDIHNPYRNTELAYVQTNFPGFKSQGPPSHHSWRASSQALSPGDSARTFPYQSGKPSPENVSPSPPRSAITADFVFDFGPQRNSPSPPCTGYPAEKKVDEKSLPPVPTEEKGFMIERGVEQETGVDITDVKRVEVSSEHRISEALHAVGSGPGRWAYYSAHKRRYGPRLAVPSPQPHVSSSPYVMRSPPSGLRGEFGFAREDNWI